MLDPPVADAIARHADPLLGETSATAPHRPPDPWNTPPQTSSTRPTKCDPSINRTYRYNSVGTTRRESRLGERHVSSRIRGLAWCPVDSRRWLHSRRCRRWRVSAMCRMTPLMTSGGGPPPDRSSITKERGRTGRWRRPCVREHAPSRTASRGGVEKGIRAVIWRSAHGSAP